MGSIRCIVLTSPWQADMNDKLTLRKAMEGASAVYAVNNYWETMDQELKVKQGRALVDAAKEAGVQHFIWSSLLNVSKREPLANHLIGLFAGWNC